MVINRLDPKSLQLKHHKKVIYVVKINSLFCFIQKSSLTTLVDNYIIFSGLSKVHY